MTVWYFDPVNGSNTNAAVGNGDSFATRLRNANNLVAAAVSPGDEGRYIGSPDATSLGINGTWTEGPYSATLVPTSSTNATPIVMTKAGHGLVTGDTIIVNGHTTNTNANGVWDVTVLGDTFTLLNADGTNSVGNGVGGATGTFRKINSCRVKLASALTKTVALTGNKGTKTNWTASANVTCTINTTDYKEGADSQQIAIAAGFTTGMAAHFPLGASTDFSAYEQISFCIKQTVGTVGADGSITISLCSDTAGATPVDTFNIPSLGSALRWVPITVDKGAALGATIQSVAFNVVTDNGAQTFLIDNIQACKDSTAADSLSLQSLIGPAATGGNFSAIQSINNGRVMLEQETNTIPAATPGLGYFGATATGTAYKRETFKLTLATATTAAIQTIQDTGTEGNLITFSGGWNTADMSTQTMETWFDGLNGYGRGLVITGARSYLGLDNLAFVRYYQNVYATSSKGNNFDLLNASHSTQVCLEFSGCNASTVNVDYLLNNSTFGSLGDALNFSATLMAGSTSTGLTLGDLGTITATKLVGCGGTAVHCNGVMGNRVSIAEIKNNVGYGVWFQNGWDNIVSDTAMSANASGDIGLASITYHKNYLLRCTLDSATKITGAVAGYMNGGVQSQNHDNTADNNLQVLNNCTIQSESVIRHTPADISWKISPTTAAYCNAYNPIILPVIKWPVSAGGLVTASLWMRRTNTGLTARLMCKGGQIAGVSSDVSSAMTASGDQTPTSITRSSTTVTVNKVGHGYSTGYVIGISGADQAEYNGPKTITVLDADNFTFSVSGAPASPATGTLVMGRWEEITITFTPSEKGVVEITAECWGGSTHSLYIDDVTISQA